VCFRLSMCVYSGWVKSWYVCGCEECEYRSFSLELRCVAVCLLYVCISSAWTMCVQTRACISYLCTCLSAHAIIFVWYHVVRVTCIIRMSDMALSFSLTHTHTHAQTHTHKHTHTHTNTLCLSLSLSYTYTHTRTHSLMTEHGRTAAAALDHERFSLALSLTHTHSLSRFLSLSCTARHGRCCT